MTVNKIIDRATSANRIIKNEGLIDFSIRALNHIKRRKKTPHNDRRKSNFIQTAVQSDVILALGKESLDEISISKNESLTINWIMPPPGKGSGGHTTLLRFIQQFEKNGHTNRIYFYSQHKNGSVVAAKDILDKYFPKINSELYWLNSIEEIKESDAMFATSWETAYASYASNIKAKRFYFVQDFEPYFYPVGGMYTLAENTYRFGFHGITAGGWLSKKLSEEYNMKTQPFSFGSDSGIYKYTNDKKRKEISCYVRPLTERRGFEIAMLSLALFNQKHSDYIINLYGWDVSEYSLPFKFNNLGILSPEELNELHNRCAASLVMSCTNMSLLPLELLSSGAIPVVNDGPNNRLVSNNQYIKYSETTPGALSKSLSEIVSRDNLTNYSKKASTSVESESWDDSTEAIVSYIEKVMKGKL